MISRSEYENLKYGDLIEIAVLPCGDSKFVVGAFDAVHGKFEYLPCSGFIKRQGALFAIVPISRFECWGHEDLSFYFESEKIGPPPAKNLGGWWISNPKAIRSWKRGGDSIVSKNVETPPLPCHECKQFYPYAVANFGDKLVCWSCRDSLGWKYGKDANGAIYLKS